MSRKGSRNYFRIILTLLNLFSFMVLMACTTSNPKPKQASVPESQELPTKISESNKQMDLKKAAEINVELGLGYLAQGQVARAQTKLNQALKLAPNLAEARSGMAYFMEMVGEFKAAEREHKKAVRASTSKGAVYNNYGAFLCRRGRFKEADQAFHQALSDQEYVRSAEVYENAGLCALKWPDLTKASEYLTSAVRRDPTRSHALLELASIELQLGKIAVAKELLERFKGVNEPSARSLWLGIQVAKAEKDEDALASQALSLKNFFENSPEYQLYLKSEKGHP